METSVPYIYAAGDVAQAKNCITGNKEVIATWFNACAQGEIAGRNMAGKEEPYNHLSYFYSDLFDLGYVAVGELDARMQTVEEWLEPMQKGAVYYLADSRVRGVLLWNVNNVVTEARALITDAGPFTAESVKGQLPLQ